MNVLYLDFSDPAGAEISSAIEYARSSGGHTAADQFADRVAQAFQEAAVRLTEEVVASDTGKPFEQPDEAASIRWAQPVYRLRVETATRRRRGNSTGLWYAYYALRDRGDTGKPDTMYVFAFVHSASQPIENGIE